MNKIMQIEEAVAKASDGMTIMFGGFLGVGTPLKCIEILAERNLKDLTVVSLVSAFPGGRFHLAELFSRACVRKYITSHAGTSPEAIKAYKQGELEIEYYPMGTLVEKIRAAGAGLGAVITPIGLGTLAEEGKEKINISGKEYLVELPLKADMAFIKGFRGDTFGNIQYRGVSINSNPVFATAADITVAEVNEIVKAGEIDPERVGTPGILVDAVVQGYNLEVQHDIFRKVWTEHGML